MHRLPGTRIVRRWLAHGPNLLSKPLAMITGVTGASPRPQLSFLSPSATSSLPYPGNVDVPFASQRLAENSSGTR